MLKNRINYRQSEVTAARPKLQFNSPRVELRWLKKNRRDLKGFVRVLEVIDGMQGSVTKCFFSLDQSEGDLSRDWLLKHNDHCAACIGALLAWFFGDVRSELWEFLHGAAYLDRHLGFPYRVYNGTYHSIQKSESARILSGIIFKLSGKHCWNPDIPYFNVPYSSDAWPVPHLAVFRELAAMYPDK